MTSTRNGRRQQTKTDSKSIKYTPKTNLEANQMTSEILNQTKYQQIQSS